MSDPLRSIRERFSHFPDFLRFSPVYYLLAACCVTGLLIRVFCFGFVSGDLQNFIIPWYEYIRFMDGFPALGHSFSDYTPPYLYLLTVGYYLGVPALLSAKLIATAGDLVLATVSWLIICEITKNRTAACLAFCLVFLTPTVIVNGSLWGQSDCLYTACILIFLYFIIRERFTAATIFFGLALAIKLQAIFLAPLFLFLMIKKRYPLYLVLIIPCVYLITGVPALIAGRSLPDLLMIYRSQAGEYPALSWNAPSVYASFPPDLYAVLVVPATLFALISAVILVFILAGGPRPLLPVTYVSVSFLIVLIVPFVLPAMHERYFFLADVLSVLYGCCYPKRFYIPVLMVAISFFSYMPFLFRAEPIGIPLLSAALFGLILVVTGFVIKERYGAFPDFFAETQE